MCMCVYLTEMRILYMNVYACVICMGPDTKGYLLFYNRITYSIEFDEAFAHRDHILLYCYHYIIIEYPRIQVYIEYYIIRYRNFIQIGSDSVLLICRMKNEFRQIFAMRIINMNFVLASV